MNYNSIKKQILFVGIGVLGILLCLSCDTDLVETYDQYIPEKVVSIAKPDSVAVVSTDYNKILFQVCVNADPKIKKAVIALFDDDKTDDDDKIVTTIDIDRTLFKPEIYEVELELSEGGSEYFVHLEDVDGNASIKYDVFGTVLGQSYKESLQARQFSTISQYSDSEAVINWVSNRAINNSNEEIVRNKLLVRSELIYTSSVDGTEKVIVVDESEDVTIIPDFISEETFIYTTFYRAVADSPYIFESNATEEVFPLKL
ncbi:DUF4998 domain-containing protein [Mariniflexile ostreae]|uniref:DUF4998 domain-containing protein n=1 Tax=Mariniflexile ostreae TaxID=1520892 RepID=A0ABV5FA57_9FLAO